MKDIDEALRRLAERGDVRGAARVFDDAESGPARPGLRSARSVVLVAAAVIAVLAIAGFVAREDRPRQLTADVPTTPFDGVFPFPTDVVLLFDDGERGIVAVDPDTRRVARRPLEGQRGGDQSIRLLRTGDALVFGDQDVFTAPLTGAPVTMIGRAAAFLPAVEDGSVWLIDPDGGTSSTRVALDGTVLDESTGPPGVDALPVRGVDGGLVYATEDGVVVWDAESERPVMDLGPDAAVGDARGSLLAWCPTESCTELRVSDLTSDTTVAADLPAGMRDVHLAGARFSPDAAALAVQAGRRLLLVDTESGATQVLVADALDGPGHLAWTEDGRRLFFASDAAGAPSLDVGVIDLDTEETARRHLPFGGTRDLLVLNDADALGLLATGAIVFEPCAWEDRPCPTTTTTTATTPTSGSSPPVSS